MNFYFKKRAVITIVFINIIASICFYKISRAEPLFDCKDVLDEIECGEVSCTDFYTDIGIVHSTRFATEAFCWHRKNGSPPRQSSWTTNFSRQDDAFSIEDVSNIKKSILEEINYKLNQRYGPKYILLDYNDLSLEAKIQHLNKEVTNNNWEILKLDIFPIIQNANEVHLNVSAVLFVKSGFSFGVPPESGYVVTEDTSKLEEYLKELIVYLRA